MTNGMRAFATATSGIQIPRYYRSKECRVDIAVSATYAGNQDIQCIFLVRFHTLLLGVSFITTGQ